MTINSGLPVTITGIHDPSDTAWRDVVSPGVAGYYDFFTDSPSNWCGVTCEINDIQNSQLSMDTYSAYSNPGFIYIQLSGNKWQWKVDRPYKMRNRLRCSSYYTVQEWWIDFDIACTATSTVISSTEPTTHIFPMSLTEEPNF